MEPGSQAPFAADPTALAICPDLGMAAELDELLAKETAVARVVHWKVYPDPRELEKLVAAAPFRLCFVDIDSDLEQSFRVLSQQLALAGRMPMVALVSQNNPDLVLRCLRQGASGFLLRPFTADQLRQVVDRILHLHPAPRDAATPAGRVIAVLPAKGACGATTVALNLACQARRQGAKRVLLADMDPLTSPVAFLLKLKSQYSFVDALLHAADLDQDLWKALVTSHQGVDVLLAPESPTDTTVESHDAAVLIEYARRRYELVVLDCGTAYGKWNSRLAALSDEVLLVATSELPALFGAQRALAYLQANGVQRSAIRLVVNRFRKDVGLDPEDIAKALQLPVSYLVPRDDSAIENAQIDGRSVAADSQFAASLTALAARVCGSEAMPARPGPRRGLLSLFSR